MPGLHPYPTNTASLRATLYMEGQRRAHPFGMTFYFSLGGSLQNVADLRAVHTPLWFLFVPLLQGLVDSQVQLNNMHLIYTAGTAVLETWNDADSPADVGTAALPVLEDSGSQVLPDQDVLILRRLTGLAGRQHRGRVNMSFLWEGFNDEGFLNTAGAAPAYALCNFLQAPINAGAVTLNSMHWNRKDNTLETVTQWLPMAQLKSRRDRDDKFLNTPAIA